MRSERERTQNQLRVQVSKAMSQVVRHNQKGQIWFEQQQIVEIKDLDRSKSLDEETLLIMIRMAVKMAHQDTRKNEVCLSGRP